MERRIVDLDRFKRDTDFYGRIDLIATIKNFDLQAIRARYLNSKKNKNARTGSVERRAPAMGGVVRCRIANGALIEEVCMKELREPRGIASHGEQLAVSSENRVYLIDGDAVQTLDDPWFSYIHTVDFSQDGKRLLVSSSGFDVILEYDIESLSRSREWWAWEQGFDQGIDPDTGQAVTLSRKAIAGRSDVRVISDPAKDSLPTAMRAAFINSVEYDRHNKDRFIATLFHQGSVLAIDAGTGKSVVLLDGLKNPHGGMVDGPLSMATSTRSGEVIVRTGEAVISYSFKHLPGKPAELGEEEWLQNAKRMDDGSILTIDSNRTSWVIFHPEKELIDIIPYSDNLAIQDLVVVSDAKAWEQAIGSL